MKPQKARPTALPVLFDNIPDELRATPSWVAWCYELDARGDWTKPPCRVRGRGRASTTDPRTWATFAEARAAYEKGGFDGIGVVLTNGIAGIDPDHAIDGDGAIKPWAAEVLDKFKGTYRERSPSGEGFRIFVHGQPKHCGKGGPDNHLEVYAKDSPRYLTVTGHALDDVRVIADKQDALDWLHATHMQRASRPRPTGATQSAAKLSDDDVIKCAREARNGGKFSRLWSGDTREYGDDHSAADAALVAILAYWTGKDHAQIDRLFRRSGLMRAKWDSRRGDSTYGDCTIAEIVARTQETFAPGRLPDVDIGALLRNVVPDNVLRGQSAADLLERPMPEISYLCNPWAPEGLALLAGRPKLGKTTLLRQKAAAIAGGSTFLDQPCKRAPIVFLSLEEGERLFRRKLELARFDRVALANMTLFFDWKRGRDGVLDILRYHDAHPEANYWVIDSLTRFRDPPDQRRSAFVQDYEAVNELHQVTNARPGLCIEVLHHTRKMKSEDPLDDISGTYGVSAAVDTYGVMRHHDEGVVLHTGGRLWTLEASKFELRRANQRWELVGEFSGLSPVQKETLEALRASGGMGTTDCARFWNIAKSTAHERLEALVRNGAAHARQGVYYASKP